MESVISREQKNKETCVKPFKRGINLQRFDHLTKLLTRWN